MQDYYAFHGYGGKVRRLLRNDQLGAITIPKSSNPDRQLENISIFDFSLDDAEMNSISSMTKPDGRINDQDPAIYEEF